MKIFMKALYIIGLVLIYACTEQENPSTIQTFLIMWENMDSFSDAPAFADRKIDKKTKRFLKPAKLASDAFYFPEGIIQIKFPVHAEAEEAARVIGKTIATKLFSGYAKFEVKTVDHTRFGYYVSVDWGVSEEDHTGHVLNMMIDLDNRIIWWFKCD